MQSQKVSIIGTVGLPANYGGFETLVENLAIYHDSYQPPLDLTVYCSQKNYADSKEQFLSTHLAYINLHANGIQSIPYDIVSIWRSIRQRSDIILILGVSGAIVLPLIRLISKAKIITNIDGIEWRRDKWKGLAKHFLHFSEYLAVRFSDEVVADNGAISEYVADSYKIVPHVIAYGGDHAIKALAKPIPTGLPQQDYAFSVCRIEPENNVHEILAAFAELPQQNLIFVGNWGKSSYGIQLRQKYANHANINLCEPIYDLGILKSLRAQAKMYIHGHSAGGTNPSLVEAMHFGIPIFAFDCNFNRSTTENRASYFSSSNALIALIQEFNKNPEANSGSEMQEIAQRRYTWDIVARQYLSLMTA